MRSAWFGQQWRRQAPPETGAGFEAAAQDASVSAKRRACGKRSLYSQALAAFCAAGSNHCTAATCFHAGQKTVRPCALDFGRLICAFHDKSSWPYRACYWAVSCKASFGDSNDPGGRKNQKPELASLNGRQSACGVLANEFDKKSPPKPRGRTQTATNRENP